MSKFEYNSYLFGSNAAFIEELYIKFLSDPNSIDGEWRKFFTEIGTNNQFKKTGVTSWAREGVKVIGASSESKPKNTDVKGSTNQAFSPDLYSVKLRNMYEAFRLKGHLAVNLDPLELEKVPTVEELGIGIESFNFSDDELKNGANDLFLKLKKAYTSHIGSELTHIDLEEEKEWLQNKLENEIVNYNFKPEEQKSILKDLIEMESFEQFLHIKFPGAKRFSVEGCETSILAAEALLRKSTECGVEQIVIGMAHRGRLNTLTKIMGKSFASMFSEFRGNLAYPEDLKIAGDVKYHLGASSEREFNGRKIYLSLASNPSHLEAVNPVVAGKVRANQDRLEDKNRDKVIGLLLHGDAAFAGQGIVAEALSLSDLEGYTTGGIIHIVINNQIGFTANPKNARKGRYATEIAKVIKAPIFHVNGDDPQAVVAISYLAIEYRMKFKKDIVIDVIGYRKHGHNETDEPSFTQPVMYSKINAIKTAAEKYGVFLNSQGVMTSDELNNLREEFKRLLSSELQASEKFKSGKADWLEGRWSNFVGLTSPMRKDLPTGIEVTKLKEIGLKLSQWPKEFNIHKKIERQLEARKASFEGNGKIDWGTAEALAYGSLLVENTPVRLSGQDSGRGTFSHRHSVLIDQLNDKQYIPLNHLQDGQAKYEVIDSNLSEYGVLGFEYGYSITEPNALVLWEGQFGDFCNGAQIMIDQFISSGENKWLRMNGLVMLLPHGHEGQGPEHTSARLERFLELCADENMQVVNCTTPASFFHVLRRQIKRNYRKPLIVMAPKSLLRHKLVISELKDFDSGTKFLPVISETVAINNVKKLILCSGKVYYDLYEEREARKISDIALVRLEQYYPFPADELKAELKKYPNAEIYWCQEEHQNMGAWNFVRHRIEKLLDGNKQLTYIGRKESASPAAGYKKIHDIEQEELINTVFK
jgi:2-oxoglutarate dehydrogenase E1 component